MERRSHSRLYESFPALVRGTTADGEAFEVSSVLDNLSAGGFYVRLRTRVEQEAKITATIRLTTNKTDEALGPRVAIEGVVVRTEPCPDGMQGIAVRFTSHRFLKAGGRRWESGKPFAANVRIIRR